MPDFEQLNFKVEAQDNATKVLEKVLKVLNELETKMNSLSNIKHPVFSMSKEQIRLIANWDKLDKKLQKVERDLKEIGKTQQKLSKYEIIPTGQRPFLFDSNSGEYVGHNAGVARREAERIKELMEKQGIQDLVNSWGKGLPMLPAPPPEYSAYKVDTHSSAYDNSHLKETKQELAYIYQRLEDELEVSKQIDEYINSKKQKLEDVEKVIENIGSVQIDWLKNFYTSSGDERLDDAIKQLEEMDKKQRAYFNALRSLENADINLTRARERRDAAYATRDAEKIRRAELDLNIAENNYLKTQNAAIKARQEMEKYNQYPDWSSLGKNLTPSKTRVKNLEGGGQETTQIFKEQIGDLEYTYDVVDGKIKKISSSTKKAQKEATKLQNAFKNVQKFLKSIGKIVLYRAIRSAMAEIKKAITTSFEDLAKYDSAYNETLSKLVTSLDVLKASMGLIIRPFVEVLEPTIGNIVDLFAEIANYISYTTAKSKGLTTYTKLNSEYAKDYLDSLKQANNLLSFDKFEVLQKSEEKNIYETGSVADGIDTSESIKNIGDFLIDGATSLKSVLEILETIAVFLDTLEILKPLSLLSGAVDGILELINNFIKGDWQAAKESLGKIGEKFKDVGNYLIEIVNHLKFIYSIINPLSKLFNLNNLLPKFAINNLDENLNKFEKNNYSINKVVAPNINDNGYLNSAVSNANSKVFNSGTSLFRQNIDEQLEHKVVLEVDFKNVNNNAISRELAKTMAEQFRKQNISVNI